MKPVDDDREAAVIFAEHAARTRFEDLAPELVEHTKLCILDTIAVTMAGSQTPDIAALHRITTKWGGNAQSTVLGFGGRVPPYLAALLNGAMAHQWDFDDTHDTAVCHPGSATALPALAVAEAEGASGRDVITAVALGTDLMARIGLSLHGTLWDYQWVRAPVLGIFGAALASGRVLRLPADQLHNALGFALPQAAGTLECLQGEGSAVRGLRDGLMNKDGVLAAYLASEGLPGDQNTFEGQHGLYKAYFRDEYSRDVLLGELGERYEGLNVSLKPWPSCRHTHGTLTALFDLMSRPGFAADEIEEIIVGVGEGNEKLCSPLGETFHGRMSLLCQLPFVVATAATTGQLALSSFSEAGFRDPRMRAMIERITPRREEAQSRYGTIEPGHVIIRFQDGRVWEAEADRALGHPAHPMSREQLAAKVHATAESSVRPLPRSDVDRLVETAFTLDELPDAGALARLAAPKAE